MVPWPRFPQRTRDTQDADIGCRQAISHQQFPGVFPRWQYGVIAFTPIPDFNLRALAPFGSMQHFTEDSTLSVTDNQ